MTQPLRIAVIGCLDTKGAELRHLGRTIESLGARAVWIDTGITGEPEFCPSIGADEVARAGGSSLAALREAADRGAAVGTMSRGAAVTVRRLWDAGEVSGVVAAGGSANTTIGTAAMRALPFGVPKVMVSTLASGDTRTWVDTKDITMMNSVVDIAGIYRISARVLGHAARAVVAMANAPASSSADAGKPVIAATMFGVTTPCVTEARRVLEEAGYEVLVFHATGTGGRAMEGLIADGLVAGVLDITTTEIADEVVGGILSAGPDRLRAAGAAGVPQVVSIGAVDMANFGPYDTVPEHFRGRNLYRHNEAVTLLRTTPDENEAIGRTIGERLRSSRGPTRVLLPTRGVSLISRAGEVFNDDDADARCRSALRTALAGTAPVEEMDTDINDPAFARRAAALLLELLS